MPDQVNLQKSFRFSPYVPYDSNVEVYVHSEGWVITPPSVGGVHPFEYTGWWDEMMSWHESCYLHAGLNPTATYRIKGPDALKFFSDTCVNSFADFPVGKGKHIVMCNEEGFDIKDGVLLRLGEDEFLTYWMWPYAEYALQQGNYNAVGENLTGKVFLYQLAGPKSLEIIEAATGEDLHDIRFIHFRDSAIDSRKVTVLRMGMAGTLAYEIHGQIKDAIPVYNALLKAGEKFGIRKLGRHAYRNAHTEGGFPQMGIHFPPPKDEALAEFLRKTDIPRNTKTKLSGSMGKDIGLRYRNPVELGWGGLVKFDHDFIGREALEKEVANPRRKMVTLAWNNEDIMDVYRSQLRDGEPFVFMELVADYSYTLGNSDLHADQVLKEGKVVGISSGRMFSPYYREMISLCSIDSIFSVLGTDVSVLWGEPGTHQREIRATVSHFPYIREGRNEHVDVNMIPRL